VVNVLRAVLVTPCVLAGIAGCAAAPDQSSVATVDGTFNAMVLAYSMSAFVGDRLPPRSTITLAPPAPDEGSEAVTSVLVTALRQQHLTVIEPDTSDGPPPNPTGAHRVGYRLTPLDNGVLVRVMLDGTMQGARAYERNTADLLQPRGPFSTFQVEAAR